MVIDVLLQDAKIDIVRAGELRAVDGIQLVAKLFLRCQFFRACFGRVIGQLTVKPMVAELRRILRIRPQILLDVIVRDFLKRVVLWSRRMR